MPLLGSLPEFAIAIVAILSLFASFLCFAVLFAPSLLWSQTEPLSFGKSISFGSFLKRNFVHDHIAFYSHVDYRNDSQPRLGLPLIF